MADIKFDVSIASLILLTNIFAQRESIKRKLVETMAHLLKCGFGAVKIYMRSMSLSVVRDHDNESMNIDSMKQ